MALTECEKLHLLLEAYAAGELPYNQRRKVAAHLNRCAAARKELQQIKQFRRKIKNLPLPEIPPASFKRASEAIAEGKKENRHGSALKIVFLILVVACALFWISPLHFHKDARLKKAAGEGESARWKVEPLFSFEGLQAPVAEESVWLIERPEEWKVFRKLVELPSGFPDPDFSRQSVAVVFLGRRQGGGYRVSIGEPQKKEGGGWVISWKEDPNPTRGETGKSEWTSPYALRVIPKDIAGSVRFEKVEKSIAPR